MHTIFGVFGGAI